MKVLYVVGACLSKNTSANMSHNAFIEGLIENGCDVDILMSSNSWGEKDNTLPRWKEANYFEYESEKINDKIRKKTAQGIMKLDHNTGIQTVSNKNIKKKIRSILKKSYYYLFPNDPVYPLEKEWIKNASKFKRKQLYDLVISNSSPAASHKLVTILIQKKHIKFKRWVQIWEDPWYFDLYGGHSEAIKKEEHYLLKKANEIYYVSPLTLQYQQMYYNDCADKMKCIPLPFLKFNPDNEKTVKISFGYFGDYYSKTRNLIPFYNAIKKTNNTAYIYGDTDCNLKSTNSIEVSERVTLDKLSEVQNQTGVLVHLCNLKGGQIPGKIYHYSATKKPILFILDGTQREKEIIKEYFQQFNRYYFCDNNEKDIEMAIQEIKKQYQNYNGFIVEEFAPKNVVKKILDS